MARKITILSTPGCPNVTVLQERLADALARSGGPAPTVIVEEITDPTEASRRGFHGSPALLLDGVDAFATSDSPTGFACRTYRTETGIQGAPSVEQLVIALANGEGR
ncbi:MAG: thioredoxin family protein [Actinomycetota bacterium]|nr:thioredoxin family protein [Actinomycetota bacterium]